MFSLPFVLSYLLTPLMRWIAVKLNIMDQPGHRKIHTVPKPRFGGTGMFISLILSLSVAYRLGLVSGDFQDEIKVFLIGSSMVFATGLLDDIFNLKPWIKLAVEILAAAVLVFHGIRISLFIQNVYISGLLTVLWIISITNSFNLLDNMDGLCAGTGAISCFIFFLVYQRQGLADLSLLLVVIIGILTAFLRFNFYPSTIIMGDSGALLVGFLIGGISCMGTYLKGSLLTHLPVITPLLILGVPIFDTLSVIYIRLRQHRSIFSADKNHFSHRLVRLGMSQPAAVLFIYLVSFCAGITSILLPRVSREDAIVILIQVLTVFAIIVFLMVVKGQDLKKKLRARETISENNSGGKEKELQE